MGDSDHVKMTNRRIRQMNVKNNDCSLECTIILKLIFDELAVWKYYFLLTRKVYISSWLFYKFKRILFILSKMLYCSYEEILNLRNIREWKISKISGTTHRLYFSLISRGKFTFILIFFCWNSYFLNQKIVCYYILIGIS